VGDSPVLWRIQIVPPWPSIPAISSRSG